MTKNQETQETPVENEHKPIVAVALYAEDVKAMGFEVKYKNSALNSQVRAKARELMGLPVKIRSSGASALIKEKLGLKADATPSEVQKAMKNAILGN